jgi:phosphatidylinositol-3-phosphatase
MIKKGVISLAFASLFCASAYAAEGPVPHGIGHLDHVFLIMMENHGYGQVVGNPDEPYVNSLIKSGKVSYATNYFAVGHPSSTNYLEIVGGSNFGIRSDNGPDWHDQTCTPNLLNGDITGDVAVAANIPQGYNVITTPVCPIAGVGTDAPTEAVDSWNEVSLPGAAYLANFDGVKSLPAAPDTVGISIADQLVANGETWKSYQESLPITGADNVTYSNGTVTDLTAGSLPLVAGASLPNVGNLAAPAPGGYLKQYAAKHDPFVYFKSVQQGTGDIGLDNVVPFDGAKGLYADLARGTVPSLSFIVPNQCNDQHGRNNGDSFCSFDNTDNGQVAGLNPGLMAQGDTTIQHIVEAIKTSPTWKVGQNAIVIVWDENDYSGIANVLPAGTPFPKANQNTVLLTVEKNDRKTAGVASNTYYDHFSLLRTLEAGFGLPCLNHACGDSSKVMTDLFGRDD